MSRALSISQEFRLNAAARTDLEAFVAQNRGAIMATGGDPSKLAVLMLRIGHMLSEDTQEALVDAVRHIRDRQENIMLLRNVPVVERGQTIPQTPKSHHEGAANSNLNLLTEPTMIMLNYFIGLKAQYDGDGIMKFRHIIQERPDAKEVTNASDRELGFHADGTQRINQSDVTALACVRGQRSAINEFVDVEEVLAKLDQQTIEELKKPNFSFSEMNNGAFGAKRSSKVIQGNCAIIEDDAFRYSYLSIGLTPKAQEALNALREAVEATETISLTLQEGDVLYWNNKKMLHKRSSFDFDPEHRRWLVRLKSSFILQQQPAALALAA